MDTLVKEMEDHRDEFVLVMAGYPESMKVFLEVCALPGKGRGQLHGWWPLWM